jgi:transposase
MAGRRMRLTWDDRDTVDALYEAYRHEAKGEVRTRLHGLWLLRRDERMPEIAKTLGVHYRTVQRWVDWYRHGGQAEVRARRGGGHGQPAYLTADQAATVKAEAATGAFHTAAEVRQWVEDRFGVRYKPTGIYRLLRRLDCRPKVPRPLHAKADLAAQAAWKRGAVRPLSRPRA